MSNWNRENVHEIVCALVRAGLKVGVAAVIALDVRSESPLPANCLQNRPQMLIGYLSSGFGLSVYVREK